MKKFFSLVLALALCAGLSVPAMAAGFSDVPSSHYAAAAIDSCVAKGVVSGYNDGTFRPAAEVTRAQFCVMLSRAFYPDAVKQYSTDANKALGWFVPNTEALSRSGALKNTGFESQYRDTGAMNQPISRYDMAQLMTNIMAQKGAAASGEEKSAAAEKIADWDAIQDAYRDAVSNVYALGIIGGYANGDFAGANVMNRAQGCAVIERMGKYIPSSEQTGQPAQPSQPSQPKQPTQPTQPAQPTQTAQPAPAELSAELVRLLNAERTKTGLKALKSTDGLTKAAQMRAKDLSGGYIEVRADGSDWTSVLKQNNVQADYVDESFVVGTGYDTAAAALEMIMSTPDARSALMTKEYTHLSVGYVHDAKGYGGYQDFWSLMYIVEAGSETPGETPSETPGKGETDPGSEVPASSDLEAMRQGVLELVNAARAENGKSPLSLNDKLCSVAQLRAEEIVQSFSHTRPNGSSCFTAVEEAGISGGAMGENIAAGQGSPAAVMNSWMNSDGHRANILNGSFSSIGIGYVKAASGYGHYWVQMFMG